MFVILCFRDVNTAEQEAQENVAAQQNEAGDANAAGEEEKKGGDEETKGVMTPMQGNFFSAGKSNTNLKSGFKPANNAM